MAFLAHLQSYVWDRLGATQTLCPVRKILVLLDKYLEAEVAGVAHLLRIEPSLSVTANQKKTALGNYWPLESAARILQSKELIFLWLLLPAAISRSLVPLQGLIC